MIPIETLDHSTDQTLQLDQLGLVLTPKPNSVLATVMQQSMTTILNTAAERTEQGYLLTTGWIASATQRDDYQDTYEQVIKTLAEPIREQIVFARTVVNPDCDQLMTQIEEIASSYVGYGIASMNVERVDLPAPLRCEPLTDVATQYADPNAVPFNPLRVFPMQSSQELLDLLMLGNDEVDECVKKWFFTLGKNFFEEVFDTFFVQPQFSRLTRPRLSLNNIRWATREGSSIALALFLWANRLLEEAPEAITESVTVSLTNYQNYLRDVRSYAANRIQSILDNQKQVDDAELLVSYVDKENNTVYVNNQVYLKFLREHEGSNETLFGLLVSDSKLLGMADIVAKAPELQDTYLRYATQIKAVDDANRVTAMKKIFSDCFRALLISKDMAPQVMAEKLRQAQDKIYQTQAQVLLDSKQLHLRVIKIVCGVLYPDTAAMTILEGTIKSSENENLTEVREAATLAVLNWVVDYLMDQTVVKPFKEVSVQV